NRGRDEGGVNALFNYGYALLRAVIARNLVSSGCLPALGIHHRNKYNAFCLADDIMEPYRPVVDLYIVAFLEENPEFDGELTTDIKKYLLQIPVLDINIKGKNSPLMVGASRTTASLMDCFIGKARKILYPEL
ncbi:MAG TPA: type II CRISPR-associated endonuclease Cas1, partial [Saprospiraceae bacterium]|nr:type II CRISPR-associated endonuclease Cas1 [Saprospiraceae bacterium]